MHQFNSLASARLHLDLWAYLGGVGGGNGSGGSDNGGGGNGGGGARTSVSM